MSTVNIGLNGKVYLLIGGTRATWSASVTNGVHIGAAPTSLTEAKIVRNVDLGVTNGEADVSTRASYWKQTAQTQADASVDLDIPWNPADACFQALRDANFGRTPIAAAILDGDSATSGTQGLWADFAVMDFSRSEPIDKEMMVKVKLKPTASAVVPEWVLVN